MENIKKYFIKNEKNLKKTKKLKKSKIILKKF